MSQYFITSFDLPLGKRVRCVYNGDVCFGIHLSIGDELTDTFPIPQENEEIVDFTGPSESRPIRGGLGG